VKLYPDKLASHLQKSVSSIYIVSGDEPLLVQESCDLIRDNLKQQGFSEREVFHVEAGFNWEQVLFSANSMSLFAEQKLLEIRMPNGKPGDKGAKVLQSFVENPPEGTTMLLVLPKLEAATQRAKWFKAIESAGLFVQVWPIDVARLPRWISDRFRKAGLTASREAVLALIDRVEGNLLAAVQEIEHLRLVASNNHIDLEQVVDGVANNARYDVFGLIDAAVGQDPQRSAKMVQGLRAESGDLMLITAMLARELRSLVGMARKIGQGQRIDAVLQSNRVWAKRKSIVGRCLKQQNVRALESCLRQLGRIDRQIKGLGQGDPWDELENLVLRLAGRSVH